MATLLLSIDFEDWHQLVHRRLGRTDWNRPHPAFPPQVHAVLDLLDELGATATFFFLGMTAENYPELVAETVARGHEPASHGYAHGRVHQQTRAEFRADLERSVEVIERAVGRRPTAYRAPAFSINRRTPWAYEELVALGFRSDSSQYDSPRIPDRLGGIPPDPYRLRVDGGELWELPVATWGRVPIGGGSYWRLLPAPLIERGLHDFSVLYFHPYEFAPTPLRADLDMSQTPRQRATAAARAVWRNGGRGLVAKRLRSIGRSHPLVSYDQAHADIVRHHGSRTRSLSQAGVLV
ncbi:MAG: polysaccharide deacetylase family protein [Gaiellaceae bacterium]|jgi:polysaccharide deacetylase family protein (PEP-CTERM system associated)